MRNNNKLAYFIIAICTIWVLFSISKSYINYIKLTRWVKLNNLNFDIINWSVKDKFIDILH